MPELDTNNPHHSSEAGLTRLSREGVQELEALENPTARQLFRAVSLVWASAILMIAKSVIIEVSVFSVIVFLAPLGDKIQTVLLIARVIGYIVSFLCSLLLLFSFYLYFRAGFKHAKWAGAAVILGCAHLLYWLIIPVAVNAFDFEEIGRAHWFSDAIQHFSWVVATLMLGWIRGRFSAPLITCLAFYSLTIISQFVPYIIPNNSSIFVDIGSTSVWWVYLIILIAISTNVRKPLAS